MPLSYPTFDASVIHLSKQQHFTPGRSKNNSREENYKVMCIKTDKERVPRYRFHHVEIKKNVLTPNSMLTFVPHLRDLESSEESKYNVWLQELEDTDRKSGFKPMSREDKVQLVRRFERAVTVSLYLELWLERLNIAGCNKSTLIRYMASQEPDDAITPRQKTDILKSHQEGDDSALPGANKAAAMFTEAFHHVFKEDKQIELRDVLLLDESVDSIMDAKPTAKEGSSPQNEDEDDFVEYQLGTYCILGCFICFSHSCEHGEYDATNCKRTYSIIPHLSDALKQKRSRPLASNGLTNGNSMPAGHCRRRCHQKTDWTIVGSTSRAWTQNERVVLRGILATSEYSKIKRDPICLVADILNRDCSDVFHENQRLAIHLPRPEPVTKPQVKNLSWYDRHKKALIGDWQDHTLVHEHQRRELPDPCSHDGPCTAANCSCVKKNALCEKSCGCSVETCAYKFTGCACHSQGKNCLSKQKEKPCICVQLNRECDPELCGTCGVLERADPENAADDLLHSTGCQNCVLQRGRAKALVLGQSQLEGVGYGLFTAENISQDAFVVEYVGELITHDEGVRREARRGDVFDEESNISYLFTLLENEGIWVDAAIYGNLSRYINHAGESDKRGCNITPSIIYVNGEFRIKFTALRDIEAGEELFFNYGENFPNLTKKLLDDKTGGGQPKKRGRKPSRPGGPGVARKAPKAEKKKPRGKKTAGTESTPDIVEDVMMGDWTNEPAMAGRKRKRVMEDDSDEEEYHPTGTGTDVTGSRGETPSSGESDGLYEKSSERLRRRARVRPKVGASGSPSKPRGQPKTRGKRGGARPGSGRPRKHPRPVPKTAAETPPTSAPASAATSVLAVSSASISVAETTVVAASPREPEMSTSILAHPVTASSQPLKTVQRPDLSVREVIEDSQEAMDGSLVDMQIHEEDEVRDEDEDEDEEGDWDDDDDDQDVVVRKRQDRATRNRRPPAKFRDDEGWRMSNSSQ